LERLEAMLETLEAEHWETILKREAESMTETRSPPPLTWDWNGGIRPLLPRMPLTRSPPSLTGLPTECKGSFTEEQGLFDSMERQSRSLKLGDQEDEAETLVQEEESEWHLDMQLQSSPDKTTSKNRCAFTDVRDVPCSWPSGMVFVSEQPYGHHSGLHHQCYPVANGQVQHEEKKSMIEDKDKV